MFLAQWPSRSLALRGCRCATEQATGPQCRLLTLPICNGRQTNSFLKLRSNPASRQRTQQADVGDTVFARLYTVAGFHIRATPSVSQTPFIRLVAADSIIRYTCLPHGPLRAPP